MADSLKTKNLNGCQLYYPTYDRKTAMAGSLKTTMAGSYL
jgi:hypothetical protein